MPTFEDRRDAGRRLAALLADLKGERPVVLALPRGGVPVGAEVAAALGAPLEVLVVRKIGAPFQPELGIGAVAPGGLRVVNRGLVERLGVTEAEIARIAARETAEMERRERVYRRDRPPPDLEGRTAIVVDDGIATGFTALAAVRWARGHGAAKVVLAAPVIAPDTVRELRGEVDELVAVEIPPWLEAIGFFYARFDQLSDDEVLSILEHARSGDGPPPPPPDSREVHVPVGRAAVTADVTLPEGAQAVVLFAHGSGSGRTSPRNRRVAAALQDRGLATVLLDLLTPDEAEQDEVTAQWRFDIPLLASRLVAATDHLSRDPAFRALPVGLYGASTGAAAALVAAARRPRRVSSVVSRGGRPDLAGAQVLAAVRAPTLLIVGGEDTDVLELNRRAFRVLTCEKALEVVPGAGHLFEEPGTMDQVVRLAGDWLLAHASNAAGAPGLA